jgi:hypothetical protein
VRSVPEHLRGDGGALGEAFQLRPNDRTVRAIDVVSDGEYGKSVNWAFYVHRSLSGLTWRPFTLARPALRLAMSRDQPTAADRRAEAIPHRMAQLLRFLPDPTCAHEPGSVDPPKVTLVSLAAVAEWAQPFQRTAPSWRIKVPRCRRRFADWVLAHVRTPGGSTRTAQPLLLVARAPSPLCS